VVLDVVGSTEPADDEGLVVVVVVAVRDRLAAYLARLTIWEGSPGCQSGEDAPAVLIVGVVPLSTLGLDALGVSLVDGEPVSLSPSGHAVVAASLGAESAGPLG
jgi:hypothetical protein